MTRATRLAMGRQLVYKNVAVLGLLVATDPSWVQHALDHFDALLVDHLHCELKAASNATALIARYPSHPSLVQALTDLGREELAHVAEVHAWLSSRGVKARPPDSDAYVLALRRAASCGG